jgi:hypothetical protein
MAVIESAPEDRPRGSARGQSWAKRLLWTLLAIELVWLLPINVALRLPLTQHLLNDIQPGQFQLGWDRAWSAYPGHVNIRGARASGQSPSQQWQASAEHVSARISLWRLLFRESRIMGAQVTDGAYRQRPRIRPEVDDAGSAAWYPEIEGYAPSAAVERVRKQRKPWTVTVLGAQLDGRHRIWLKRSRARFDGGAEVNLAVRSPGGPLDLEAREVDFYVERAWAEEDTEIVRDSALQGYFKLGPYRPREQRGGKILRFIDLDLALDVHANSLDFLELFLLRYPRTKIDGRGHVAGRLQLDAGRLRDGSRLQVDAEDLSVTDPPFIATGAGKVDVSLEQEREFPLRLDFLFDDLEVLHSEDRSSFFTGSGFRVGLGDRSFLLPIDEESGEFRQSLDRLDLQDREQRAAGDFRLTLELPQARVEDMRTFNRYLPGDSSIVFAGGSADLTAKLDLHPDGAEGEVRLHGDQLAARIAEQQFEVDLLVNGVVSGGQPRRLQFNLDGTEVVLDRARVMGEEQEFEGESWSTQLVFDSGSLTIAQPARIDLEAALTMSDSLPFLALFRNSGAPQWLVNKAEMEDIRGRGRLSLRDGSLYIPEATVGDEKIAVSMKGVIDGPIGDGVILMRYGQSHALLEYEAGKRHLVLIKPSARYEAYEAPLPPPD